MSEKKEKRQRRHKKIRVRIFGTAKVPRLCVFRSSKHIYAQLIDDEEGKTILSISDSKIKKSPKTVKAGKVSIACEVGKLIAQKAIEKKIKKAVFDRGGYKYHGRVKAVAEGAREAGLIF